MIVENTELKDRFLAGEDVTYEDENGVLMRIKYEKINDVESLARYKGNAKKPFTWIPIDWKNARLYEAINQLSDPELQKIFGYNNPRFDTYADRARVIRTQNKAKPKETKPDKPRENAWIQMNVNYNGFCVLKRLIADIDGGIPSGLNSKSYILLIRNTVENLAIARKHGATMSRQQGMANTRNWDDSNLNK